MNNFGVGVAFSAQDMWSAPIDRMVGAYGRIDGAVARTEGSVGGAMMGVSASIDLFGKSIAALSVLEPAAQAASEFGTQVGQIRTLIDETAFSTKAVTDTTLALADAYGVDGIKGAGALYETISAGVMDAGEATKLLGVASKFAVGGNAELAQSIDVLTSATNTYGIENLSAQQASDALFVAIAAGKTTARELADGLGNVAPTANAMGVSFDELTAAIAAMTVQGIKTPQAITAMNAMLANVAKPTSDAAKEAKRLGIEFNVTALKSMGLAKFLGQLSGNAKVNDNTFANLFGSIDGIKGALALTANNGGKFADVLGQMEGKANATDKAFKIMEATSGFQEKRFEALKKNALIFVGQGLEPIKAGVLSVASTVLSAFTKIPAPIRDVAVRFVSAAIAVGAVVGAVLSAKIAVASFLAAAGTSAAGIMSALLPIVVALGAVVLAFYAVKRAYDENLGGIGELINEWVDAAKLAWDSLVQVFTDGGFSGAVRDNLQRAENQGIKNFVVGVFLAFNRIKNFFTGMSDSFSSAMTAMEPTFTAFKEAVSGLADAFSSLYETNDPADATSKFEAFGSAGAAVGKVLASVAGAVVKIFTAGVQLVTGFINNFGKIKTAVQPILDLFGEIVTEIFSAGSAFDTAGGGFTSVGEGIASVVAFILTVIAQLVPVIRAIVKAAGQQLRGIVTALSGVIDIVAGILSGDWGRVWTGAKKIVFAVLNNIISGVLGLVAAVAASMDKIAGFMGKDSNLSQTIQDWSAGISASLIGPGGAVGTAQTGVADAAANASMPGPNASTPTVSAPPMSLGVGPLQAFVETEDIASAVASGVKGMPAPVTNVKVTLDSADLMSKIETESRSSAGASFTPGIPVVG
jgi:TP901 family phage tail tape measure protein